MDALAELSAEFGSNTVDETLAVFVSWCPSAVMTYERINFCLNRSRSTKR